MSEHAHSKSDRRTFLSAATGFAAAGMASMQNAGAAAQGNQQDIDRKVQLDNPQIGQPVSQTAKAQNGQPIVPQPPAKKLGYCIVGLGKFAVGQILPAFDECEHAKVVALVSGDRDKAEAIATKYNVSHESIYSYDSFDKIRDNKEIDIVYVILPNALHAEYTIRGLKAGKHVLCEKPMATSIPDCEAMINAANEANKKLMIAYRVQYEPYNMKAIEWAREKKYGPIQFISSDTVIDVGGPNQWRLDKKLAGGGSLMDIGIYSVNAMRYLTGEEPEAVSAFKYQDKDDPRFSDVEQTILFQMRFPSGVVTKSSSSYSTSTLNRFTVVFRDGWLKLDPATTYQGHRFFHGTPESETQLFLPHVSHFAAEMDHLAKCIKNNEDVKTPGEEGLRDLKVIKAIYEAAETGETINLNKPA